MNYDRLIKLCNYRFSINCDNSDSFGIENAKLFRYTFYYIRRFYWYKINNNMRVCLADRKTIIGMSSWLVCRYEFKSDNNVIHSSCVMCYKYATVDLFAKLCVCIVYSIKYK